MDKTAVIEDTDQSDPGLLFKNLASSMNTACDQLRNGTTQTNLSSHSNLEHFWTCMRISSDKLSNEVTKLSLIFSKAPPPTEEVRELINGLEAVYVDMLTTFYMLPKEKGVSLQTTVKQAVLTLLGTISVFVASLEELGVDSQKKRLEQTGQVWEACEAIQSLPTDNLQVLCKLIDIEEALVVDALNEIEEEVRSDSLIPAPEDLEVDLSESWSNSDRALLPPCVGLVKTARAVLKKVSQAMRSQAKCDTTGQITELDELAEVVQTFSPGVDDLIAAMYPPISRDSLLSAATVVVSKIDTMLKTVQESHYATADDQHWIDFLLKAVDHNNNKLQELLVQSYQQ